MRFRARRTRSVGPLVGVAALFLSACHGAGGAGSQPHPATDSVNIGYGSRPKDEVATSVSTASGNARGTATSAADLIDGRFPGVEVTRLSGGGVSIRIRGARSIHGDGEPLYVIDGIPKSAASGVLTDLDPRDIKSISVLKDAAATSVYGVRGANGVILIATKKGP